MDIRIPIAGSIAALALLAACARDGARDNTVTRAPATEPVARAEVWYCPMHPTYQSDHPGNCPICNMKLVLRGSEAAPAGSSDVEGRATIVLEPERRKLIGVRTGTVERGPFARTIRAAARVDFDERTLSVVSLRFGGTVEELFVRSVGEVVKEGDPLLAIWSPELLEAQKTYLIARGSSLRDASAESARRRLLSMGRTEEQIRELEQRGEPERLATVLSKTHGTVTKRSVSAGSRVEAGATLLEIADLSGVWVVAEVFENEIPLVRVGQEVSVESASLVGDPVSGRVEYVYPVVDEATRTARVRVAVANPDGRLRPGAYATASIVVDLGEQIAVDDDAILDSGTRRIVFVVKEADHYEPREISIGARSNGRTVVTKGLAPGETIVTSGNFLVDSESRLKSALEHHASGAHERHGQ